MTDTPSSFEVPRVHFDDLGLAPEQTVTWKGCLFTGIAFENYPGGGPRSESPYVDGIKQGVGYEWYPSGRMKEEGRYWNGVRHGITRRWDEHGRLTSTATYEFGILIAEDTFDERGTATKRWRIGTDDPSYEILQLSRKRFGPYAPPV
jgi:hypothetical protein